MCHFFLQIFMLLWLQGRTVRGTPRVATVLSSPPSLRTHLQSLVTTDYWWVVQSQEWLTNINILLTISIHHHMTRLWELLKWQPNGKCFDFFVKFSHQFFLGKRMEIRLENFRSLYVSGKLPTYPSPKPTLTLTSHLGQNVVLGEG